METDKKSRAAFGWLYNLKLETNPLESKFSDEEDSSEFELDDDTVEQPPLLPEIMISGFEGTIEQENEDLSSELESPKQDQRSLSPTNLCNFDENSPNKFD